MARQPSDAERVEKPFFARHAIPVAYLRWDDSRPIHRTKTTTQTRPFLARSATATQTRWLLIGTADPALLGSDANPIDYPQKWTPMEYTCKCGVKGRVDVEFIAGPFSAQPFQHSCGKDEVHEMPGPIIATWEERDGARVRN
jgi:hypothetical protein